MADTDVLTQDEADQILKIGSGDTSKDAQLQRAVTTVSQILDGICGPVVRRVVTDEVIDRISPATGDLFLKQWPVHSVTMVTEYDSAGAATVLTLEDYDTKPTAGYWLEPYSTGTAPHSGRIYRRSGGGARFFGAAVKVTYVAGRYENTAAVGPLFKDVAGIILRNFWVTVDPQSVYVDTDGEFTVPLRRFPSFGVPQAAIDMLDVAGEYRTAGGAAQNPPFIHDQEVAVHDTTSKRNGCWAHWAFRTAPLPLGTSWLGGRLAGGLWR